MGNYTAPLRDYIEQFNDGTMNTRQAIEAGREKLFDFDYPVFDPNYKTVFETNFIRNFYMREIGFETFGYFKFQLETWLLINMPYFNKLFESELMEFDPLSNSRMDTTYTKNDKKSETDELTSTTSKTTNIDNDKTTNANATVENVTNVTTDTDTTDNTTITDDNFERNLESQTPDGRLNITTNDGEGVIEYANQIKENTENNSRTEGTTGTVDTTVTGTENTTSTQLTTETDDTTVTDNTNKSDTKTLSANNVEEYIESRVGKIGVQSYAKLLTDYRNALLRVEKRIFDEMNELFMLVY